MDRPATDPGGERRAAVDRLAGDIEYPPEYGITNRCTDRHAERLCLRAAAQPRCASERHDPHNFRAEMLLHFRDQWRTEIRSDRYGIIDRRQHPAGEGDVDDRAVNRDDAARTATGVRLVC